VSRPPWSKSTPTRPKREKGSVRGRPSSAAAARGQRARPAPEAATGAPPAPRKPPRKPVDGTRVGASSTPAQSPPGQPATTATVAPEAPWLPRPSEPDYHVTSWTGDPPDGAADAARAAVQAAGAFRCGEVVLAGQPNAGKSTLLNRLLGEKLAIVSPRPQTTRDNLRGILTTTEAQLIFLDTPGIHRARSPLNRAMVGQAVEALESVDVAVLVVDAPKAARWLQRHGQPQPADEVAEDAAEGDGETGAMDGRIDLDERIHPGDRRVIRQILRHTGKWMIALNKIDLVKPRHLLPLMQVLATAPQVGPIVPVSAWTADGLRQLVAEITRYLPVAEAEFGADELTDRPLRYLVAELVREQVFLQIREEVPYGVACETEVYEELEDLTHIQVLVHVEKPAQRGILVGKGGARMKALATLARQRMEQLTGRKVFLEVHVRVEPDWPQRLEKLRDFGYIL
jgi:GTP-binding protein Era